MAYCNDIMTTSLVTCTPRNTVTQASQVMEYYDVGSVPVVDDANMLVGIITDRDIAVKVVATGTNPETCMVSDVMTRELVTCYPNDDLETARSRMSEHQVRRLPIVNSDGYLVGIIAQADLLLRTTADAETEKVIEEISKPEK